jgi:large subunit ribosomal protein L15
MFQLNSLHSLVKKRKRVGRGGSRGGTSGKGHKGQKARSGPSIHPSFEGGQMPLTRRLPKRGFNNSNFRKEYTIVGISALDKAFEQGQVVTKDLLLEKGLIRSQREVQSLVKVLSNGTLTKNLIVHADAFSESARKAIHDQGGQAVITKER